MAEKCSDLEKAINTLVTEFNKASGGNSRGLNADQFNGLLKAQLPTIAKTVGSEQGLATLMQQMGVREGEDISFSSFWKLIQSQSTDLYGRLSQKNSTKCSCLLL